MLPVTVWMSMILRLMEQRLPTTESGCANVELVSREEWGARPPKEEPIIIETPVNMTFMHHTSGSWECHDKETCILMMQDIQNFHMDDRGWNDIGYSFVIGEDGRAYEGRGWDVEGAHTLHYNDIALGFCIIGDFMGRLPNQTALDAAQNIIQCGVELGYITNDYELFGHRDGRCTDCPGDMLYGEIQTWPHYSFRDIPIYC